MASRLESPIATAGRGSLPASSKRLSFCCPIALRADAVIEFLTFSLPDQSPILLALSLYSVELERPANMSAFSDLYDMLPKP
jgi:hypothetical protein